MLLNLTTRPQFQTLLDAVSLTGVQPHAPAIIYLETGKDPITVTRKDFRQQVENYAGALQDLGVLPRDLIILAHTQNLESIFAFWGAMLLGAIPSMFPTLTEKLDPEIYMSSMAQLVKHSDAKWVLTTDEFAPQLAQVVGCRVTTLTPQPHSRLPKKERGRRGEVAFLQHSSGTTGLQKGVALSHEAVLNQLASYSDALALTEKDVIVSWLPLYHDMGLIAGFLLPLVQGIPLVLMSPFDWVKHPAMLFRAIHDYQGTLCWLPNFAYNHSARRIRKRDTENLSLKSMRAFINCSEPVHASSHRAFYERFRDNGLTMEHLTVSYAMAENVFAVTQTPIGKIPTHDWIDREALENERQAIPSENGLAENRLENVSCGKPIEGVSVQVMGDAGDILPERHVGELYVKSNFMLTGYYQRPDLNEKLFKDGWYTTGDMGYLAEGEIFIIGRKKDLIINGGKNIYPQDVEAIVNTVVGVHPGRAVAFGVYDEREGTELIGIVAEVDTDDESERQQIANQIRQAVAQQSTVTASYVYLVDDKWLIKTSSGKIARAANRDKWLAERE